MTDVTRREFVAAAGVAALAARRAAGQPRQKPRAAAPSPSHGESEVAVPVIDLHAHVFNVGYLPVAGALKSLGVPVSLARWIETTAQKVLRDRNCDRPAPGVAFAVPTVGEAIATLIAAAPDEAFEHLSPAVLEDLSADERK